MIEVAPRLRGFEAEAFQGPGLQHTVVAEAAVRTAWRPANLSTVLGREAPDFMSHGVARLAGAALRHPYGTSSICRFDEARFKQL